MSSQSSEQKIGQLALPGQRLGVIEEYIPDVGTYVKDGVIFSKVVGRILVDFKSKHVSVHPLTEKVKVPKIGSTVTGQVLSVQGDNANVRIFRVGEEQVSGGFFSGVLHVSDANLRFVDSIFDVCKAGDILRADVISDKNRTYHLSTKEKNLGVTYAFCSHCGYPLEQRRQTMHCARCGNIERRKPADDYGKGLP